MRFSASSLVCCSVAALLHSALSLKGRFPSFVRIYCCCLPGVLLFSSSADSPTPPRSRPNLRPSPNLSSSDDLFGLVAVISFRSVPRSRAFSRSRRRIPAAHLRIHVFACSRERFCDQASKVLPCSREYNQFFEFGGRARDHSERNLPAAKKCLRERDIFLPLRDLNRRVLPPLLTT